MPTITEVYDDYAVPQNLRDHMLRVAAIGELIFENWTGPDLDRRSVLRVLLLHDTGNFVKMDAEDVRDSLPENVSVELFEDLREKYTREFGQDDHAISEAIARDIGLSDREINLMQQKVFMKNDETASSEDWEAKIGAYADQRVAPDGVMSLEARLQEAKERYEDNPGSSMNNPRTDEMIEYAHTIESQVMKQCAINPGEITDDVLNPVIRELKSFEIK